MKALLKFSSLVALLSVALGEVTGQICPIDDPGLSRDMSYEISVKRLELCFKSLLNKEMTSMIQREAELAVLRTFFKDFCSKRSHLVTTCLAEERTRLSLCNNTNVSVPVTILSDLIEQVLISDCKVDGEHLAVIFHGYQRLRQKAEQMTILKNCLVKATALNKIIFDSDIDLTSKSYLAYELVPKLKGCLKDIHCETMKSAAEWFIDEIISSSKCQDLEENLVPCRTIDVADVNVTDVCELKQHTEESFYDELEKQAMKCFSIVYNHDLRPEGDANTGDLDWLKEDYKRICHSSSCSFACVWQAAGFAESCLPQDEGRQFQLFIDTLHDVVQRGCQDDGVVVANIMHEIYSLDKVFPENGKALRECAKMAREGHAASSKNMRFYLDVISFRQCLVEKLFAIKNIAEDADTMISDIVKKMKCVNSEDDTEVPCETIVTPP